METKSTIKCLLMAFLMLAFGSQVEGAISKSLNVTAGNLGAQLGSELNSITDLALEGDINGTDIGVLRSMPNLSVLNLANVNIVAGGSFTVNGHIFTAVNNQIPDSSFYGMINLASVQVPNSLTSIGQFAFYGCSGLVSFSIGNGVTSISRTAFCGGLKLKEFIVSESNASFCSVEGVLFNKNKDILIHYPNDKSAIYSIPASVTSIEWHAFCTCPGITSITIPAGVAVIGNEAFCDCSGLTEIHCKAISPPSNFAETFSNANQANCKLYVPIGTYDSYRSAAGWGSFTTIIEETQTFVPEMKTINSVVYTEQGTIVIKGANLGETISVYTPFGTLMQKIKVTVEEMRINVPDNQVYIVKIAGKVYKVAL